MTGFPPSKAARLFRGRDPSKEGVRPVAGSEGGFYSPGRHVGDPPAVGGNPLPIRSRSAEGAAIVGLERLVTAHPWAEASILSSASDSLVSSVRDRRKDGSGRDRMGTGREGAETDGTPGVRAPLARVRDTGLRSPRVPGQTDPGVPGRYRITPRRSTWGKVVPSRIPSSL